MIIRSLASALSPGAKQGNLTVLIFHRVLAQPDPLFPEVPDARRFHELMAWVRRWFRVLPLDVAAQHLVNRSLPARALSITFDDGYADNISQALPVLQYYGMPATFFVSSGYMDRGCMWNDAVIEAVRCTHHMQLNLHGCSLGSFSLRSTEQRRLAIDSLLAQIKYQKPEQRLQSVAQVVDASQVAVPTNLMMRSDQLQLLRNHGMQIGAHTVTHPILEKLTDPQCQWEITQGKRMLEVLLGEPVKLFAYPNGKPGVDYSARHVAMVRAAGFSAAVSTASGVAVAACDPLQLPRYTPSGENGWGCGLRMLRNLCHRQVAVVVPDQGQPSPQPGAQPGRQPGVRKPM